MSRSRTLLAALLVALVGVLTTTVTVAAPASAVVPDQIRYAGASIFKASVPAAVVDLEVWSSTPAARVDVLLGGAVVASDTTVEARAGYWLATARVDLSRRSGSTSLTMRVTGTDGAVRSAAKGFTVVAPSPAPKPSPVPAPKPVPGPPPSTVPPTTTTAVQPDQIRWNGASVHSAVVPTGRSTALEVWSSTPATKIELLHGDRVVGTQTKVEARSGYWLATFTVDLSGLPAGAARLTMRVTPTTGAVRTSPKSFTADPVLSPLTPAILSARAGASTTGVPAGTTLRPSGPLHITVPGTVVSGLDVAGCVVVAADDVTIRRSRIRCGDAPRNRVLMTEGTPQRLLVEDVEIDGRGTTDIGVDVSNATLRRLQVHRVNDGVRLGKDVTLTGSWVHSLVRKGDLHPDAVQGISAERVVIRGNTLDARGAVAGEWGNAAIQLGSEAGTMISQDVTIEGNYLSGGNCTLNVSGAIDARAITIRSNRFGDSRFACPVLTPRHVPVGAGNVMDVWGTAARVQTAG